MNLNCGIFEKRVSVYLSKGVSVYLSAIGQRWEDVIDDEIPQSKTFLTCLSKAEMDKKGYFHVEQHRASEAALRVPPEQLFILPVILGDCGLEWGRAKLSS